MKMVENSYSPDKNSKRGRTNTLLNKMVMPAFIRPRSPARKRALSAISLSRSFDSDSTLLRSDSYQEDGDSGIMITVNNAEEQEDFFDIIARVQNSRMDDQRCSILPSPYYSSDNEVNEETVRVQRVFRIATQIVFTCSKTTIEILSKEQSQMKMDISAPIENQSKDFTEPVKQVLALGAPFPMVVLPVDGEFWMEGTYHVLSRDMNDRPIYPSIDMSRCTINEDNNSVLEYRKHFAGREHMNFAGIDNKYGPVLLSVHIEPTSANHPDNYRLLLRLKDRTIDKVIPVTSLPTDAPGPRDFMKYLLEEADIEVDRFHHVCVPRASEDIKKFDEHTLNNCYKVGIVYQDFGQTNEDEYLQNQNESPAFREFLDLLAERVELKDFSNYRGGLDVKHGQTGEYSYYTSFQERELMFHVSTLLPFNPKDSQQVCKKRHIGNDVVTIIFQEENTPFCPNTIRSHFLHVFVIVQVEEPNTPNTRYKVSITAKEGVPKFSPSLPNPCIFKKGREFREFLLTKIINAEIAAIKSEKFSKLAERTRTMLLERLVNEFINKTEKLLEDELLTSVPNNDTSSINSGKTGSILSSFRSALYRNSRTESANSSTTHSTELYSMAAPHSLSLNDLTCLATDSKKDSKDKKEKKNRKSKHIPPSISPRSISPTIFNNGRSYTDSNSSGEVSPVLRHPDSYRHTNLQPKSRCFSNQLFGQEPFAEHTQSLPRIPNSQVNMNGTRSPPSSPLQSSNSLSTSKLTKNSSNQSVTSSESNSETEDTASLAQAEISKLKSEINQLKMDKMDLMRQNVIQHQKQAKMSKSVEYNTKNGITRNGESTFRRNIYHSSVKTFEQMRKLQARVITATDAQYV